MIVHHKLRWTEGEGAGCTSRFLARNTLPRAPSKPRRERAKSHEPMRHWRQTCGADRDTRLCAGNRLYSRKTGKVQSWGKPAPSPTLPNARQSLGFPIRRNVARCRAASYSLYLTCPMSNLAGLRLRHFSGSKFFRPVERCTAPFRLNHVQHCFNRFADVSHAHRLSSVPSFDTQQRIEKDSQGAEQISQGRGKHD